jgi:hypothetical protein
MNNQTQEIDLSTTWIENLAISEINMDESGIVDLNEHLDPIHYLEESSINLMNQIKDQIEYYVSKFNQYRGDQNFTHIKIFKISNTVNDFMLFRNSLRLVFARKANDLITVAFLSHGKDLFAPRLTRDEGPGAMTHEIRAHIGPFNKISWRFQGEEIEPSTMIRHYMTEFIKQSAR